MRRIRMKKSRKYEQDKLQAAINASARRALDDLEKSSGMLSVTIEALRQGLPEMAEKYRKIAQDYKELRISPFLTVGVLPNQTRILMIIKACQLCFCKMTVHC